MRLSSHDIPMPGGAGTIFVRDEGPVEGPVVFMTHSILSSGAMWDEQAALLVARGFRVVRPDARGHGASRTDILSATMLDLVSDSVLVLDTLGLNKVHYVGLSLGGMSGFGLGIHHPDRLLSLCLCDARADAPADVAAPWDERIMIAESQGCGALAEATIARWFGTDFVRDNPVLTERFGAIAGSTSVAGFSACARAIQSLDFLPFVSRIHTRTSLIVGEKDGVLPEANQMISERIAGCSIHIIPNSGHLPNVDNIAAFNGKMLDHLDRGAAP